VAFATALLIAPTAVADDKADVMTPIHQFVDGFNEGDAKRALAACAEQTSIIDEFPPHEWHGQGACATWANDFVADAAEGIAAAMSPGSASEFGHALAHACQAVGP